MYLVVVKVAHLTDHLPVNTEDLLRPLLTREDTDEGLLLVADAYFDTNNINAGKKSLFECVWIFTTKS